MGSLGDLTCDGGVEFIGLIKEAITSRVIGDGTFSIRRAASLHASVIEKVQLRNWRVHTLCGMNLFCDFQSSLRRENSGRLLV
jgi:hypothetical protein